jgi:hypothetical protein
MAKALRFFLQDAVSLRYAGFFLFVASFITPTRDFKAFGYSAFIATTDELYRMCASGEIFVSFDSASFAAALFLGWLSNFSVPFRLPLPGALASMAAP